MEWIYNLTREGNNLNRLSCINMVINVLSYFSKKSINCVTFPKHYTYATKYQDHLSFRPLSGKLLISLIFDVLMYIFRLHGRRS